MGPSVVTADPAVAVVAPAPAVAGPPAVVVLAGPTRDSLDIRYARYRYALPTALRPGDRLHFRSAGASPASYSSIGFNGFAPLREEYR